MQQEFLLQYWEDDGWLVGRLRGMPGIFSQGKDLTELEVNIREVYELMTEDEAEAPAIAKTKDLPLPS